VGDQGDLSVLRAAEERATKFRLSCGYHPRIEAQRDVFARALPAAAQRDLDLRVAFLAPLDAFGGARGGASGGGTKGTGEPARPRQTVPRSTVRNVRFDVVITTSKRTQVGNDPKDLRERLVLGRS